MRKSPFVTRSPSIDMSNPAEMVAFRDGEPQLARTRGSGLFFTPHLAKTLKDRNCVCPHMDSLKPFFVSHVLCLEYFILWPPRRGQDNRAGWTD